MPLLTPPSPRPAAPARYGLASLSIVAAHGGRLWATPNDRRGATFHFVVPAEGHPAPSSER